MAEVEAPQLEVVEIPDVEEAARSEEPLPDALPILPLRETVTYPDTLTPLAVTAITRSLPRYVGIWNGTTSLPLAGTGTTPENSATGLIGLTRL